MGMNMPTQPAHLKAFLSALAKVESVPEDVAVLLEAAAKISVRTRRRGDCLEWTGARTAAGYGTLWAGGRNHYVHRVMLGIRLGRPLESHEQVMHACDHPWCCRPEHLSLGSNRDNQRDASSKGRCRTRVLTIQQVRRIRAQPEVSPSVLAARYGVSVTTICHIRSGRRWGGVA